MLRGCYIIYREFDGHLRLLLCGSVESGIPSYLLGYLTLVAIITVVSSEDSDRILFSILHLQNCLGQTISYLVHVVFAIIGITSCYGVYNRFW